MLSGGLHLSLKSERRVSSLVLKRRGHRWQTKPSVEGERKSEAYRPRPYTAIIEGRTESQAYCPEAPPVRSKPSYATIEFWLRVGGQRLFQHPKICNSHRCPALVDIPLLFIVYFFSISHYWSKACGTPCVTALHCRKARSFRSRACSH